jgi:hypothetical protein
MMSFRQLEYEPVTEMVTAYNCSSRIYIYRAKELIPYFVADAFSAASIMPFTFIFTRFSPTLTVLALPINQVNESFRPDSHVSA